MLATLFLAALSQFPEQRGADGLTLIEGVRKSHVRQELHGEGLPAWAGTYNGFVIAPKSGFVLETPSCGGPIVSLGTVTAVGNRLELKVEEAPGWTCIWWYVPWDQRHYLIPERQMASFCMSVNDGSEPRADPYRGYLMRLDDQWHRAKGRPEIPLEWQSLLLDAPLETKILRIERRRVAGQRDRDTETRVLLHLGLRDGVRTRLGFHLGRSDIVRGFVESVGPSTCVVLLDAYYEHWADRLRVGDFAGTKYPE